MSALTLSFVKKRKIDKESKGQKMVDLEKALPYILSWVLHDISIQCFKLHLVIF